MTKSDTNLVQHSRSNCKLITVLLFAIVVALLAFYIPRFSPIKSQYLAQEPQVPFSGILKENDILLKHSLPLAKGKIQNPESLVISSDGNLIYTAVADGTIVMVILKSGEVKEISKIPTSKCVDGKLRMCVRPLGMRLDINESNLYVIDAFSGLYKISLITKDTEAKTAAELIFPSKKHLEAGFKVTLFNDFDILPNGTFIIAEASVQFDLNNLIWEIVQSAPTGRLLSFDPTSDNYVTLHNQLYFPNGVQLHPDGESVLVCETNRLRILRYYFAGDKTGQCNVFYHSLPGYPDNIRISPDKKAIWVALYAVRHPNSILHKWAISEVPTWIRDMAALIFSESRIGAMLTRDKYGYILKFNVNGNLVKTLQDPTGETIHTITQVDEAPNGDLYLSGLMNNFVGHVEKKFIQ